MSDNLPAPPPGAPINPIEIADPATLVALFDADPSTIPQADLDSLIREYRNRADANRAEVARQAAAPKTPRKVGKAGTNPATIASAATADKPIADLQLGDLFDEDEPDGTLDA